MPVTANRLLTKMSLVANLRRLMMNTRSGGVGSVLTLMMRGGCTRRVYRQILHLIRKQSHRMLELTDKRLLMYVNDVRYESDGEANTSWFLTVSFCHAIDSFLTLRISLRSSWRSSWCMADDCCEYAGMNVLETDSLTNISIRGFKLFDRIPAKWLEMSGRTSRASISMGRV